MATPPANPKKMGNETRSSILPVFPNTGDFMGPVYSYADEMPLPNEVGVRQGDDLSSVTDSIRGVAYYADMIGYGEASNFLTQGMGNKPKPLGINYFVRTGSSCSNGADMWVYVNGIPAGTALGTRVREAMAKLGMPALKGLAPGILEDAQAALDPTPVVNAIFGSGYAQCKSVTMPVGDYNGKIVSGDGQPWIKSLYPGDIRYSGSMPSQTRWIFDKWLTQEEYERQYNARVLCADGTQIVNHAGGDCAQPLLKMEGFKGSKTINEGNVSVTSVFVIAALAFLYLRFRDD
jgi:hypothetical protein